MRAALLGVLLSLTPTARAQTVEELQRLLKEREAKIRELSDALEKQSVPEDEELNRALERTLVQQGALLLPPGGHEFQPQVSYAHWDRDRGPFRYEWDAALAFRAGLGRDWQIQASIPYVHLATPTASTTDFGDLALAVSKQLAPEESGRPAVLASAGWVARTGQDGSDGKVPTGGGFNVLQGGVTLVKRYDPLVYFGGVSYAAPRSREISGVRVQPGNTVGLRGGAVLAATPHTSVNAGLNLGFVGAARVAGQRVADSDAVVGALQLGFGTVLSRRAMLNVSGEFRVSGALPNFRLILAVPVRF